MKELIGISSKNRYGSFNDSAFILQVVAMLNQKGNSFNAGEYMAKCNLNGHIKVLKALGLYKTTGKGPTKKVMVNDFLDILIRTHMVDQKGIADTVFSLMNGEWTITDDMIISDTSEYDALGMCIAKTHEGGFGTYLIKNPATTLTKIGRSKNAFHRLEQLRNEFSQDLYMIAFCEKDHESRLHFEQRSNLVFGEWFDLSDAVTQEIINKYGFNRLEWNINKLADKL